MQEKKNNALEKAENIANKPKNNQKNHKKSTKAKKSVDNKVENKVENSSSKERKATRAERKAERLKLKQEKKLAREKVRAEREKALAQKRVELARIKAHKKAEKQKAKATALREKIRRKQEMKERKQLLKEQRIARREALKKETKKERHDRILKERRELQQERQRIREQRAQKRREKLEHQRAMRQEKQRAKEQKRKDRQRNRERNRGYGGWLAAVISLGIATLVLASVLTFTFMLPSTNDLSVDSLYHRAFYDAVEQVENIDLNLSKSLATKDGNALQKYLLDTAINSELAENDIQELPLDDEYKFYTAKVINQIGDYSKYLINKLIDGENLTAKDKQGLENLYNANLSLKQALNDMVNNMGNDYSFESLTSGGMSDVIISGFNDLKNLSVTYPELIYDGPFSDGQQDKVLKGLDGVEISESEAQKIFSEIFSDYSFESIESVGQTDGVVACYNVQGVSGDNILYAQITKKGGKLIMFSFAGDCNDVKIQDDQAIESGLSFLQDLGLENMQEVWINLSNNVYTINYAYTLDGVIVYPDMVKLRVCAETGKVIGLEAKSYYTNHTIRKLEKASLTERQARDNVFDDLQIQSVRKAIIPLTENTEKLCYEFSGQFDGNTYYVYIDATNGHQLQMFKVVDGTEGQLLM
ncbi:MAG: hypothetical protein E7348_01495 [Clostridiales bacterium]|nr:hypothetical protein [Clostridiales bacterium]